MSPDRFIRPTAFPLLGRLWLLCTIPLLAVGCGKFSLPSRASADAHEGDEPKMVSVTVAAEKLELFMEHPYFVQGKEAKSNVHLPATADALATRRLLEA